MNELKELFLVFEEELNIHLALIGTNRIKLNGTYVNDINEKDYFVRFIEIKTWVQENVEISEDNLSVLQNFYNNIKQAESRLEIIPKSIKGLFELFDNIDLIIPYELPVHPSEILLDENTDKSIYILNAIKDFYEINEHENLQLIGQEELNRYLINNSEINLSPEDLPMIYSFGHMSYVLKIHKEFLSRLTSFLKNWISNFSLSGKFIEQNEDFELNPHSLYFDLSKKEVATLFHTFHELNFLKTDKISFKKSDTDLRKFLNKSNLHYLGRNKEYMPIIDIGKSFDDLFKVHEKHPTNSVTEKEITFLNNLINKLQDRLCLLESKL